MYPRLGTNKLYAKAAKFLWAAFAFCASSLQADVLEVPNEYATPAIAISMSQAGDTVLLHRGLYAAPLEIPGRDITIAGEYLVTHDTLDAWATVIAPDTVNPVARCIVANSAAPPRTILHLIGLKLQGGYAVASTDYGGGMIVSGRTVYLDHCRITKNVARFAGAFSAENCKVIISDCSIDHNRSLIRYGNIFRLRNSTLDVRNSLIGFSVGPNESGPDGEMIVDRSTANFKHCTFRNLGWLNMYGSDLFVTLRNSVADTVQLTSCYITNCRISRSFQINDNSGVRFYGVDSCLIELNQVAQGFYESNHGDSTRASHFVGNIFRQNLYAAGWAGLGLLLLDNGFRPTRVESNIFLNNNCGEMSCLYLTNGVAAERLIVRNYVFENTNRALASPPGGISTFERLAEGIYAGNIMEGNFGNAAYTSPGQRFPSYALHNYWGAANGPFQRETNPNGEGDTVSTQILYDPFEPDTSFLSVEHDDNRYVSSTPDFLIGFAYPNPFNSEITINYVLTKDADAHLVIYNLQGQEVATLVHEPQRVGVHEAKWQADNLASGIYFAALSTAQSAARPYLHKLVLLK